MKNFHQVMYDLVQVAEFICSLSIAPKAVILLYQSMKGGEGGMASGTSHYCLAVCKNMLRYAPVDLNQTVTILFSR